jgi:uncharacterized protein DUF3179
MPPRFLPMARGALLTLLFAAPPGGLVVAPPETAAAEAASADTTPSSQADERPTRIADRMRGRAIAAQLPPLDNPAHKPRAAASSMRDEDWVLGVVVGGRACAYPWWVVKNYHVVNDTIAGVPLAVSFCEQCTGGAAFKREHRGRVLSMAVAGVYNGTILLKDRDTGTLWAPFSGRALEGPLAGERLERLPLSLSHWDEWAAGRPTTEVVDAPATARSGHGAWYRPASGGP